MHNILVPYDFSDIATDALKFAADISRNVETSKITVINIIEQPSEAMFRTMGATYPDPSMDMFVKKLIDLAESKMEALMADEHYKDIDLNYKVVLGHPYKEISEEIKIKPVTDLVVMGTSGATGAEEFLIGSNAEKMVRHAQCPVITISEYKPVTDIHHIVFASDFKDVTPDFIRHVKGLQAWLQASLKLVKINTPASFSSSRQDKQRMQEFIANNGFENCTAESYNYKNEEDGIIAYAEDVNADMIAIGTRQRRGLGHFLAGSIAEDIVNHSKIPVWTYAFDHEED